MKKQTIKQLNQLNRNFYQNIAADFSDSRNYAWEGWKKIKKYIRNNNKSSKTIKILDIACGNARFAKFLITEKINFDYLGLDNSKELLELGKAESKEEKAKIKLEEFDLVANYLKNGRIIWPTKEKHDFIVAFGLSHHLPSDKLRQDFINSLEKNLSKDGLVIISNWQFATDEKRFAKNILNSEKIKGNTKLNIWQKLKAKNLLKKLEANDYLLDWRRYQKGEEQNVVWRYCHYLNEAEMKELIAKSNLQLIDGFYADGKSEQLNQYFVLKKRP